MIKLFKWVAVLEGISLLVLLLIAMPLKYYYDRPEYVRVVGMAHGVLFIGYIIMAIWAKFALKWSPTRFIIACAASIVPLGTFYVEKKYLN